MDIFGKYLLARNAETRQGQNMLAMAQQTDAINKDRKLRNILSEAYTPAIPAESRMGPTQPGQPLRSRGRMDMGNALGAMYEGGFGPEAMAIEGKQAGLRGATPSMVNEYKFWSQLPKEDQEKYLQVKRTQKFLDTGEGFVAPSMVDPTATRPVVERTLKPTEEPEYIKGKIETEIKTKETEKIRAELATMEAGLPGLREVTTKLSELGKTATFTKAGQMADEAARQFGGSTKGGIARAEYISMVANEILPLLRETFGAAFTKEEGESLKITLGDPNSTPEEKDAQLRSFMASKERQIRAQKRRVGEVPQETKAKVDYKVNQVITNTHGRKAIVTGIGPDGTPTLKPMR